MGRVISLDGQAFGWLTAQSRAEGASENRSSLWNCLCRCGKTVIATSDALRSGQKRKCGVDCPYRPERTQIFRREISQSGDEVRFQK